MISIIVIISDKDYHLFGNILRTIKETAGIPYELLVADNREEYKNVSLPEGNYKLIDMGGNKFQFLAKKRCIPLCKYDWIWVIDGDDEIINFPPVDDLSTDADMICYNFERDDGLKPVRWISENYSIENKPNCFTYDIHQKTSTLMWCSLLRKSMLMKFVDKLPEKKLHNFEDFLWIIFSLYHSTKIDFRTTEIYLYNSSNQDSDRTYYDSIIPLQRWATGTKDAIECMNNMIPAEEQDAAGIKSEDIYRNGCINFIEKYYNCNKEIRPDFMKLIKENYDTEYITMVVLYWIDSKRFDKIEFLKDLIDFHR